MKNRPEVVHQRVITRDGNVDWDERLVIESETNNSMGNKNSGRDDDKKSDENIEKEGSDENNNNNDNDDDDNDNNMEIFSANVDKNDSSLSFSCLLSSLPSSANREFYSTRLPGAHTTTTTTTMMTTTKETVHCGLEQTRIET